MTSPETLYVAYIGKSGWRFYFGFRWRQAGWCGICVNTQWPGAQDAVCMEPDGRWPQIPPPVDRQLLITTCDNRRPPPSHPSGLGGGLPQGKSALRVFPMEVPWWPCLSLSRSWTVCGEPGVSHSYMDQNDGKGNNDKWFFLSKFPFLLYRPLICRAWSDL